MVCLKNFSKLLKRKKNDMNREHLCHKFYRRLYWYHNYCSVMQKFLKVTFSYQTLNYLEFKLWIMTKNKTKIKVILMEPVNPSKTIILANKISKSLNLSLSLSLSLSIYIYIYTVFSHLVNIKLCYNDSFFKYLLTLSFK